MAKVKITGHASGTGVVTVTAPNTSTDRTITLPDSTDTLAVNSDVTNKLPLAGGTMTGTITGFTSTGIDDNATSNAITIDASEQVGIGRSPLALLHLQATVPEIRFTYTGNSGYANIKADASSELIFSTGTTTGTERMRIDSAGRVTMPYQPSFDAYHNASGYSSGTSVSSLDLNATRLNVGGHYNTSNDRFTAPVAGVYQFNYRTIVNGVHNSVHVRMHKNGSFISGTDSHYSAPTSGQWNTWTHSIILLLAANDYVSVIHTSDASIHGGDYQSFNGFLIG